VSENGRKKNLDAVLALALAGGASTEEAAHKANCSSRTVRRRLQEPEFRALVDSTRTRMVDATIGKLSELGGLAVEKLKQLLQSASAETVQLGCQPDGTRTSLPQPGTDHREQEDRGVDRPGRGGSPWDWQPRRRNDPARPAGIATLTNAEPGWL
jgi:hypothetical protein